MPPSMMWLWPSTKPGISTLSAKRSSFTAPSQHRMSSVRPTARMRPSRTATWLASGNPGVMVMILRAEKIVIGEATEIGRAHVCQSLMRISYAVFCLKKKKAKTKQTETNTTIELKYAKRYRTRIQDDNHQKRTVQYIRHMYN